MDNADIPPTQPSGALVPPPRGPRTAVATATPEPPNRHARHPDSWIRRNAFQQFVARTLDAVDDFADTVAAGLGLRHR
ncbi:MAG TPA: hypothetical protein VN706_25130 [Gemmatimonadaceae bacterium]|nr:hypothetical protein [Gemmatimonadaceae bacterium]